MMSADSRSDWSESRERFRAFWQRELVDRCCMAVRARWKGAPAAPVVPAPTTYEELVRAWVDPEANLKRMLAGMERTFYGGEAYPATTMCLGASAMAAFYGARVEFRPETVWFHPAIRDIRRCRWDTPIEAAPLYRETFDATRYYASECRGRYLVGLPEIGSATDDLSLLRGMQELLYDMIDAPDAVHRGIHALVQTWCRVHTDLFHIARPCNDGGCCIPWMQTWAPGPHYQMACDFSAILSPEMFREFIVPELEGYMSVNEYSVYHWDGPDAVKHLDALLELPALKAIQWTPGAGQPRTSSPRWLPHLKRIQAAGKCLILPCAEPDEVETLLAELSSRGLFISTYAATEDEARALLRRVAAWTHD
ncbi:MAG: hypothetical protein FJ290_30870 [Planctomycetes bacterium]|nr:hypothetical protein [Planctomycetota bacterium]